jgi:hypothetical protein
MAFLSGLYFAVALLALLSLIVIRLLLIYMECFSIEISLKALAKQSDLHPISNA